MPALRRSGMFASEENHGGSSTSSGSAGGCCSSVASLLPVSLPIDGLPPIEGRAVPFESSDDAAESDALAWLLVGISTAPDEAVVEDRTLSPDVAVADRSIGSPFLAPALAACWSARALATSVRAVSAASFAAAPSLATISAARSFARCSRTMRCRKANGIGCDGITLLGFGRRQKNWMPSPAPPSPSSSEASGSACLTFPFLLFFSSAPIFEAAFCPSTLSIAVVMMKKAAIWLGWGPGDVVLDAGAGRMHDLQRPLDRRWLLARCRAGDHRKRIILCFRASADQRLALDGCDKVRLRRQQVGDDLIEFSSHRGGAQHTCR